MMLDTPDGARRRAAFLSAALQLGPGKTDAAVGERPLLLHPPPHQSL
jgi:hypothetical protein